MDSHYWTPACLCTCPVIASGQILRGRVFRLKSILYYFPENVNTSPSIGAEAFSPSESWGHSVRIPAGCTVKLLYCSLLVNTRMSLWHFKTFFPLSTERSVSSGRNESKEFLQKWFLDGNSVVSNTSESRWKSYYLMWMAALLCVKVIIGKNHWHGFLLGSQSEVFG